MHAYRPLLSIRTLLGLVVALAVLFAPSLASAAERGMAMPNHQVQMLEMGHCQSPPSSHGNQDKNAGHSCCVSVSMGLPAMASAPIMEALRRQAPAILAAATLHLPELIEIATPPPRLS